MHTMMKLDLPSGTMSESGAKLEKKDAQVRCWTRIEKMGAKTKLYGAGSIVAFVDITIVGLTANPSRGVHMMHRLMSNHALLALVWYGSSSVDFRNQTSRALQGCIGPAKKGYGD